MRAQAPERQRRSRDRFHVARQDRIAIRHIGHPPRPNKMGIAQLRSCALAWVDMARKAHPDLRFIKALDRPRDQFGQGQLDRIGHNSFWLCTLCAHGQRDRHKGHTDQGGDGKARLDHNSAMLACAKCAAKRTDI